MFINDPISALQLLAQADDAEEWVNILFIVVVAVFWAIGGIIKAAGAGRTAQQRQKKKRPAGKDASKRETWLQQLARKAEQIQRAVENQSKPQARRAHQPQREAKPSKPPAGRVTVRSSPGGRSVLVYERQARSAAAQRQDQQARKRRERASRGRVRPPKPRERSALAQPETLEVPSTTTEPLPRPSASLQAVPAVASSVPLVDYSDPDALKRAILHYEILGKPLAFRDPLERTSPF